MKYTLTLLLFLAMHGALAQGGSSKLTLPAVQILRSGKKDIRYTVNNGGRQPVKLQMDKRPVRVDIECRENGSLAGFYTGADSIAFVIKEGEQTRLLVLVGRMRDTAIIDVVGIASNTAFSDAFVKQHKGKTETAVPEVLELVNIAVLLSPSGAGIIMTDKTTPYYKEVQEHFSAYHNHPLVTTIDRKIGYGDKATKCRAYENWALNACAATFRGSKIVGSDAIKNMASPGSPSPVAEYAALLESFAAESGFREFYKNHAGYYASVNKTYTQLCPARKMQSWLEKIFRRQYGCYNVYVSPLMCGPHRVRHFDDKSMSMTLFMAGAVQPDSAVSTMQNEVQYSGPIFSDMGRNYSVPLSGFHAHLIETTFSVSKWSNQKYVPYGGAPVSEIGLFNDYMAAALFSLYCADNFTTAGYEPYISRLETEMEQQNGCVNFKAFNRKAMALYSGNKKITADELFKQMLLWSYNYRK